MMEKITEQTLQNLRKEYNFNGLYKTSKNENILCPHINALVNIGLVELGYLKEATNNIELLLKSGLYDQKHKLFYREASGDKKIANYNFNTCKNALMALVFYAVNKQEVANEIIDALFNTPLFDKDKRLFFREHNNDKLNSLIITQTNLWVIIALLKLGRKKEAKELFTNLININLDVISNMFFSHDCESDVLKYRDDTVYSSSSSRYIFVDDQALIVITYFLLGEKQKAKEFMDNLLESDLYDISTGLFNRSLENGNTVTVKSTYKNSLCGIALGMLGYTEQLIKLQTSLEEHLYDKDLKLFNMSQTDDLKVPDNSMLALLAIEYKKIGHIVF